MLSCPKLRQAKANLGFLVCDNCDFNTKNHKMLETIGYTPTANDNCPQCMARSIICLQCGRREFGPKLSALCKLCYDDSFYVGIC